VKPHCVISFCKTPGFSVAPCISTDRIIYILYTLSFRKSWQIYRQLRVNKMVPKFTMFS